MKKSRENLFAEIKIKMVMKVYGISRSKAMEIIAKRGASEASTGDGGGVRTDKAGRHHSRVDDDMVSAEDFFSSL